MAYKRINDTQGISLQIDEIMNCVQNSVYDKYFVKIGKQKENLLQLMMRASQKIEGVNEIELDLSKEIKQLSLRWIDFTNVVANKITDENVKRFRALYSDTRTSINRIVTIPKSKKIIRTRSSNSIIQDLQNLENTRKHIQQQIDFIQRPKEERDDLTQKLKGLEAQMAKMLKEKDAVQKEEQIEKNWDTKIQQAFVALKKCTSTIEEEKNIASNEYQRIINIIYVLSTLVVVWLISIYKAIFISHIFFGGWVNFLPYYLPIPLFLVVFWVLIVQKNRASKLSITLSDELYRIRYMEGILLAINKLSDNSESSITRINKALDVMVESFLHQVEKTNIDEKGIEAIEKKELNTNKYIQIIDKLIGKL